jgi:hypothetical protein
MILRIPGEKSQARASKRLLAIFATIMRSQAAYTPARTMRPTA